MRSLLPISLLVAGFCVFDGTAGAATPTPPERIAAGVSVAGVPVGGLTVERAAVRLNKRLGRQARRPVVVTVAGRRARFAPLSLGVTLDLDTLARRALVAGRRAAPGAAVDVPVRLRAHRAEVLAAVARLDRLVRGPSRSARLRIRVKRVVVLPGRPGRALRDTAGLARRIRARLADPFSPRRLVWRMRRTRPGIGPGRLARRVGNVVTISRGRKLLRLFVPRRGRYRRARTYRVAVGRPGAATPRGSFNVQSKSVNPAWTAPSWAGPLAGQTIPGGSPNNPIKARWIGVVGGVGIHGTADIGSLGGEASRGCIRMSVPDVRRLYLRVRIGTPVLIR